jgi:hypothetical protein
MRHYLRTGIVNRWSARLRRDGAVVRVRRRPLVARPVEKTEPAPPAIAQIERGRLKSHPRCTGVSTTF